MPVQTLTAAYRPMQEHACRHRPAVDEGLPAGIVTVTDLPEALPHPTHTPGPPIALTSARAPHPMHLFSFRPESSEGLRVMLHVGTNRTRPPADVHRPEGFERAWPPHKP